MQQPSGATPRPKGRARAIARGRAPQRLAGLWAVVVVTTVTVINALVGFVDPIAAVVVLVVAVALTAWLWRPAVLVTDTTVVRRGLIGSLELPVDSVEGFEVTSLQMPMHRYSRMTELVIRRTDGTVVLCPWVAWNDMITPLLTAGTRPVTASQRRVLERLNLALGSARQEAKPSSEGSVPQN